MTLREAHTHGTKVLADSGVGEASLNAEYLLAHVLSIDRSRLESRMGEEISSRELRRYGSLLERRAGREPLQYVLGSVGFMGLTLAVDRRALIPRPETESLVEAALEILRSGGGGSRRVLDVGTGSGNIALAIVHYFPDATVTATDLSQEALDLAAENAGRAGIRGIRFVRCDVFDDFLAGEKFDMIVANPPYVSLAEFEEVQPEIRLFEPRNAVTDGSDGMRCIRRIVECAPGKLNPAGSLLVEIGFGQAELSVIYARKSGFAKVSVRDDLGNVPRVLIASREAR